LGWRAPAGASCAWQSAAAVRRPGCGVRHRRCARGRPGPGWLRGATAGRRGDQRRGITRSAVTRLQAIGMWQATVTRSSALTSGSCGCGSGGSQKKTGRLISPPAIRGADLLIAAARAAAEAADRRLELFVQEPAGGRGGEQLVPGEQAEVVPGPLGHVLRVIVCDKRDPPAGGRGRASLPCGSCRSVRTRTSARAAGARQALSYPCLAPRGLPPAGPRPGGNGWLRCGQAARRAARTRRMSAVSSSL